MHVGHCDLLRLAQAGISHFLDLSGPPDEYFLEYVRAAPEMKCLFSCDLRHLRARLDAPPAGRTALIDAVFLALNEMRKARHSNRALMVVTDGFDNESVYQFNELKQLFAEAPVPIFMVILVPCLPGDQEELTARAKLAHLANSSGGYMTVVAKPADMQDATTQLASDPDSVHAVLQPPSAGCLRYSQTTRQREGPAFAPIARLPEHLPRQPQPFRKAQLTVLCKRHGFEAPLRRTPMDSQPRQSDVRR